MAEQQLRQDKHGCYYWATDEPGQTAAPVVVPPVEAAAPVVPAAAPVVPAAAPAKRTRGPRKSTAPAGPAAVPVTDTVVIPPPPVIRG